MTDQSCGHEDTHACTDCGYQFCMHCYRRFEWTTKSEYCWTCAAKRMTDLISCIVAEDDQRLGRQP